MRSTSRSSNRVDNLTTRVARRLSGKTLRRLGVAATLLTSSLVASNAWAIPSFPGAEGFGAVATGGRGGTVLKVTNLNADGPGSLQWALDQSGPRIVVFEVSGVIPGDITVNHGDVTIAGETAPGGGITIRWSVLRRLRRVGAEHHRPILARATDAPDWWYGW